MARPEPRRLPLIAIAAGLSVTAIAGYAWRSRSQPAPAPVPVIDAPTAAPVAVTIAVQDIELALPPGPDPASVAEVLGILVEDLQVTVVDGERLRRELPTPATNAHWLDAASKTGAQFLARGSITATGDAIVAAFEVIDVRDRARIVTLEHRLALDQETEVMSQLAEGIARVARPDAARRPVPNRRLADRLLEPGSAALRRARWRDARVYLEQAVVADPTSYEAWVDVGTVRGWMLQPSPRIEAAIEAALARAPEGKRKQILLGTSLFYRHDYARARDVLLPLSLDRELPAEQRRDVLYYLGEVDWHDGDHEAGDRRFREVLAIEHAFKPAAVHAGEYALAKRSIADAGRFDLPAETIQFAAGEYAALADGSSWLALPAHLVLGRAPAANLEPRGAVFEAGLHRLARAIERGDYWGIRREFPPTFAFVRDRKPIGTAAMTDAEVLAELVIAGELADEAKQVLALMRTHLPEPAHSYRRLAILAAPVVKDLPTLDKLNRRTARLREAITAELAGDRKRAADLLVELVRDPSAVWDYPERLALLRNLRAAGRHADADHWCADTMKPAIYRVAYLVARRACPRQALR